MKSAATELGFKKADKKRHYRVHYRVPPHWMWRQGRSVLERERQRKVPVWGGWLGEGCQVRRQERNILVWGHIVLRCRTDEMMMSNKLLATWSVC